MTTELDVSCHATITAPIAATTVAIGTTAAAVAAAVVTTVAAAGEGECGVCLVGGGLCRRVAVINTCLAKGSGSSPHDGEQQVVHQLHLTDALTLGWLEPRDGPSPVGLCGGGFR
jgi:hypothetical protein